MKQVININFHGQVIAIEETAYEILKQYIQSLKKYFSGEEGGDEIVNDIESRIAELFGNRLKHGIPCITDEDVEAIISSIGKPEDFDSDYEEASAKAEKNTHSFASGAKTEQKQATSEEERGSLFRNTNDKIIGGVCSGLANYFKTDPVWVRIIFIVLFGFLFWVYIVLWIVLKPKALATKVVKRLYRNPNDKFIGGVCGGIATYFKIDSWIPRIIFLMPLMFNLIGMVSIFPLNRIFDLIDFNWKVNFGIVLAYIVLLIIIPEAKTVKQKLEMMGEDEYIKSIRETVSDNVAQAKSRTETDSTRENNAGYAASGIHAQTHKTVSGEMPPEPPKSAPRTTTASASSEKSGCLYALVIFLKIIFFSFVGIFAVTLVAVFIGILFTGTQLLPLKGLFIDPGTETTLLMLSVALMILVPIVSIIIWIVRRGMKAKSRPVIGIVATVLWFLGISLAGVLTSKIAGKYQVESSREKSMEIMPVKNNKLYVGMQPYTDDYAIIKTGFGTGSDIDELPYLTINEDSLLFRKINLQIRESADSVFIVRTIAASRGKDLRSTKADIEQFTYNVVQKDSVLLLPEFLSVPATQGFRDQSMTVEILVPAGKKVEISDALKEYKNNRPPKVVRKKTRKYTNTYSSQEVSFTGDEGDKVITADSI